MLTATTRTDGSNEPPESPSVPSKSPLVAPNSSPAPKEVESPSATSESSTVKQEFLYEAGPPTQSYIQFLSGTNNANIQYSLGKDRQTWKKEEIEKGQVHTVRCREYPFLKVETKINNQTSQKIYQLECQSRYTFMWNGSHRRWELRKIRDIK